MHTSTVFFPLICLLLLNGCATPQSQELAVPKAIQEYQYQQALVDIKAMDWPSQQWWVSLHDPQLNRLIEEGLSDAPGIAAAQARLQKTLGVTHQLQGSEALQVSGEASVYEAKASYSYTTYVPESAYNWNDFATVGLNFSYDLDFWGKNHKRVEAAVSETAAKEAELASARLQISTSIAKAYAELTRLYYNLDTAKEVVEMRTKTTELLSKRFDNGLENKGAVNQASSLQASAEADRLAIEETIALQKNVIAALVGAGPDRGLVITRPIVALTQPLGLPKDVGVGLIGHRPDITASRWQVEAAAKQIGVAQDNFYPDVSINAFIGYQSFGIDNLVSSDTSAGNIGPAIYLPIFNGGQLQGQLTVAEAEYELAVSNYNQNVTNALKEVADVVTSDQRLQQRIDETKRALSHAREAQTIATNRYKGGLATYLDVLTAENAVLSNQRALVNLQSRSLALHVQLIHALGGGFATQSSANKGLS
ncbi:efflux transporter outer membrane subunit [Alteromonas sp. C1M14]|uniref:efflux transporter outer membrane subunit n=1 Tax=Alteromonas sp. C1M14 TaxID=2841567 RepID=UPI001C0A4380|nr:efflux transporter outer membrane subunit [Alteromonas sp. C1M14]MBU2979573.1 efflux transporter outer membrane subunit [Alteromonas sp. C1M14]